eukprot:RCo047100
MSLPVRTRADDTSGASVLGGGKGKGHFPARSTVNLALMRPEDLPSLPEATKKPVHPTYKTTSSAIGAKVERAQVPYEWHGTQNAFTRAFPPPGRDSSLSLVKDRSRVLPDPQFGANPFESLSI